MYRAADNDFSASNEELLEQCKRQDQEALRLLFRRHERPVYNLLFRMLSNHEDAEEALAEVFVKVWRAASGFKGNSKFTTWLFRIASNTARDCLRSRKAKQEVYIEDVIINDSGIVESLRSNEIDPAKAVIDAESKSQIFKAMKELSEEDRLLISLYHIQELDYSEIAQIMNTPPSNLKVKLFRARQKLKKLCIEWEKGVDQDEMRADTTESTGLRNGTADWA